jgi:hypothetical protein
MQSFEDYEIQTREGKLGKECKTLSINALAVSFYFSFPPIFSNLHSEFPFQNKVWSVDRKSSQIFSFPSELKSGMGSHNIQGIFPVIFCSFHRKFTVKFLPKGLKREMGTGSWRENSKEESRRRNHIK